MIPDLSHTSPGCGCVRRPVKSLALCFPFVLLLCRLLILLGRSLTHLPYRVGRTLLAWEVCRSSNQLLDPLDEGGRRREGASQRGIDSNLKACPFSSPATTNLFRYLVLQLCDSVSVSLALSRTRDLSRGYRIAYFAEAFLDK